MISLMNSQSPSCVLCGIPCCQCNEFAPRASQKVYPIVHCRRRMKLLPGPFMRGQKIHSYRSSCSTRKLVRWKGIFAAIEMSKPEDYEVGSLLGSYGYMNITSYAAPQSGGLSGAGMFENSAAGYTQKDIEQLRGQDVGEGNVQIRLYSGRVSRGSRMGTRVIFKAYPGRLTGGVEADVMAANELAAHAFLQDVPDEDTCPNLQVLLGGFETNTGEQWLVFRDDGKLTAANYAKAASEATTEGRAVGEWNFWDRFDRNQPIKRRQIFLIKLLRGAVAGLAYMHARGRLHQSLGPASVVLNTMEERDVLYLVPRLRDLAFAVDVSDQAIFGSKDLDFSSIRGGSGISSRDISLDSATKSLSDGLWRRATSAGAFTSLEKRAFGIADDIYAAGLFLAYMAFIPLCEAGSIDGPSLQRLLESTFQLDIQAAREYCQADDRWSEAVNFLDLDDGAGWELLQVCADSFICSLCASMLSHQSLSHFMYSRNLILRGLYNCISMYDGMKANKSCSSRYVLT
eukprot:Gb_15365 [translate_table: standard]